MKKKGMTFEVKLTSSKPLVVGAMTREQLEENRYKGGERQCSIKFD